MSTMDGSSTWVLRENHLPRENIQKQMVAQMGMPIRIASPVLLVVPQIPITPPEQTTIIIIVILHCVQMG